MLEDFRCDSVRFNAAYEDYLSVFYCYKAGVSLAKLLALSGCVSKPVMLPT